MRRCYVGVDGGGTKTAMLAMDESGTVISQTVCGPLNYHFVGVEAAVQNLEEGLRNLALDGFEICAVGIGDPSIDDSVVGEVSLAFAERARQAIGAPVWIRSDAFMTLYALTRGERRGVLIISGTGAMAMGEDEQGALHVAGGWGRLSGDEGSGYYIGLCGIKAALRYADGIAPATSLLEMALDFYDCRHARRLIDVFYGETSPDVAGFAKVVSACAEQGDAVAIDILKRAARYLADYTRVLLTQCDTRLVGVYGSVLCKNKIVRAEFERLLLDWLDAVRICEPTCSAQYAAALYAQKASMEE